MDAERGASFKQRPAVCAAHSLLVHRVTGLVHGAEQQRERLPLDPARRDPDIVWTDPRGERMHRLVLPPSRPVEAEGGDHVDGKCPQVCFRVGGVQEVIGHRGAAADGLNERDLSGAQRIEQAPDVGGLQARFVIVEQDVVRMLGRRKEGDLPLLQVDHLLQVWLEQREIGGGARLRPRMLRGGDDGRVLRDKIRGDPRRLVVVARRDPDAPNLVGIGIPARERLRRRLDRGADFL